MRKFIIICFVFFLSLSSCVFLSMVSKIPYVVKKNSWLKKSTPLSDQYLDTIKLEITTGMPIGEATIAGETRRFLFDTGAYSIIDAHDVHREGVRTYPEPYYGVRDTNDRFYQLLQKRKMYKSEFVNLIDTLAINNTFFGKVGAGTMDFKMAHYINHCNDKLGIIGYNVMNDGVWSFDYSNEQIIFSNSINNFDVKNAKVFDIKFESNDFPVITLPVGDTTLRVGIDTGNNSSAISTNDKVVEKYAIKHLPVIAENIGNYNLSHYVLKTVMRRTVKLIQLETDFLETPYQFTAITGMKGSREDMSSEFDLVIGHDFIKDYIVTIDYINEKAYFQKAAESKFSSESETVESIGFSLSNYDRKTLYVSQYLPHLIDSTQVDIGDTVLAVNETPIDSLVHQSNYCEFIRGEKSLFPDKDTSIITVKNKKGEVRDFKSYKVTLFDD